MKTILHAMTSYVCRGAVNEKDAKANGNCGGGWWGEVVPEVCPNCGRDTFVTGVVQLVPLPRG